MRKDRLISFFLCLFGNFVAISFARYLGSEGTAIMTTGRNVVLFGILILGLIFLFRLLCIHLQKKSSFLLVFLNIFIYFVISLFFFSFRIYFVSNFGLFLGDLFSSLLVCSVVSGGGHSLPLPAPSGPSRPVHSTTSTEDSFGIRVLMEPWPITPNLGLESSIQHRALALENDNSPFLLDKEKREYWKEIKTALTNCSSQRDYNWLLEFENRDLRIRELKHSCYTVFQEIITKEPALAENAAVDPKEVLIDFLDAKRTELDEQGGDVLVRDRRELRFLTILTNDLRRHGPNSAYINTILGGW